MTNRDNRALLEEATALRLKLLENGYEPIPNRDKRTFFPGWPHIELTRDEILSWQRRFRRDLATGLRLANMQAVVDVDINDEKAADAVYGEMCEAVPRLTSVNVLERGGKGYKIAMFCRTAELFSRIHSRRWLPPGASGDAETACVEIFGGASHRQFGAFGPHTRLDNGDVTVEYEWNGYSPADVPLAELETFTKAEFFAMVNAAEAALRELGWEPVKLSEAGENDAIRVYDLVETMQFHLADGRVLSLSELREVARGEDHLRCSASWLEGPSAKRPDRCLIGVDAGGRLFIWESSTGVTHLEAERAPRRYDIDIDRIAEKLKELEERQRHKLVRGDDARVAATKLLGTYAFCPNQQKAVVPLWARSMDEGMVMSSFRTMMLPHADTETGPRGGTKTINPVDIWAGSERRKTVQGLRMRPDMPRPTYTDEAGEWVNTYSPPVHDAEGGSAAVGVEFMSHLFPDESERRWFLQAFAHKVLYPWVPGPAIVMVARDFGTGRGTLAQLMTEVIGREYVRTIPFAMVSGSTYQSQYNDWGASTLVAFINEADKVEDGGRYKTRHNTYEHLKELVEPRPIEKHFVSKSTHFKAMSFTTYIIFTNNPDALPIPETDRRFAILSNGDRGSPELWAKVNAWMAVPANVGAFVEWLKTTDLSDYSPYVAPVMTAAKATMVELSKSDLEQGVALAIETLAGEAFTPEQIVNRMRKAATEYRLEYRDGWKQAAVRLVQKQFHRVGERDGNNWRPQIEGKRYAVYARSAAIAKKWTSVEAEFLRMEVLRNGDAFDNYGQEDEPGKPRVPHLRPVQ